MTFIWIGLIITLTLIELLKNNLITIWYIFSSICALFLSFFIDNYFIQFGVFSVIGTALLLFFRDKFLIILKEKREKILIGKTAIVIEDITKKKIGKIKIGYRMYNAISNKKIKKGAIVKIVSIDGYILKVEEEKNGYELYKKIN